MAYSSLTPRLVRYQVEKELGLPKDALEVPKYKEILKCAINDAMVCAFLPLVPRQCAHDGAVLPKYCPSNLNCHQKHVRADTRLAKAEVLRCRSLPGQR